MRQFRRRGREWPGPQSGPRGDRGSRDGLRSPTRQPGPDPRLPATRSRRATESRPAPEREPLPTTADGLPALGRDFDTSLDAALEQLDLAFPQGVRAALEAHARLLLAWNRAINLTAHRTPAAVAREHVADSLAALPLIRATEGRAEGGSSALLDLGSGGGYPGLALAVALTGTMERASLVDSIAKKVGFLDVAANAALAALAAHGLPVPQVRAVRARAETLAHEPGERESWSIVTARAIAPMPELAELALPLVAVGGRLIAWKRDAAGSLDLELEAARRALAVCGAPSPAEVVKVPVVGLEDHRIVIVVKEERTPSRFPREPAERRRESLGTGAGRLLP